LLERQFIVVDGKRVILPTNLLPIETTALNERA